MPVRIEVPAERTSYSKLFFVLTRRREAMAPVPISAMDAVVV